MKYVSDNVKELLKEEAGDTTWHLIAKTNHIDAIRENFFGLDVGDINTKNKEGKTPIDIALEMNNLEMIKELIQHAPYIPKNDMSFYLLYSENKGYREIKEYLDTTNNKSAGAVCSPRGEGGLTQLSKAMTNNERR
jgi:hypothetical protein